MSTLGSSGRRKWKKNSSLKWAKMRNEKMRNEKSDNETSEIRKGEKGNKSPLGSSIPTKYGAFK